MTIEEKAKILDALIANHGAIIDFHVNRKWDCCCDPDVGAYCEECSLKDLLNDLIRIDRFYSKDRHEEHSDNVVEPDNVL
jgi:hypothetical protein